MLTLLRCLWWILCATTAVAQAAPDTGLTRAFGAPDAAGSFRARFARDGGGMVWLQAADHYHSLAAARKRPRENGDYLLLVDSPEHALRLFHTPSNAFPQDIAQAAWTISEQGEQVTFTYDGGQGLQLEKVLRHDAKQRGFVLEIALKNTGSTVTGALDFTLAGAELVNPADASLFGTVAVAIAAPTGGTPEVATPAQGALHEFKVDTKTLAFAGCTNRFFGAFVWPLDAAAGAALSSLAADTLPHADAKNGTKAHSVMRMRYGLRLQVPPQDGETRVRYGLYFGPKAYSVFATLPEPERFAPILDVDLNTPFCCIEMPGGRPMAKFLLWLLGLFHGVVGNWGVAIMMLTILVRGLLSPLNFHMQKSMRAYSARMAELKPKLDALKQKHGDDQRAYQQAMIAFQREHKLLPPLGGCLPIFLTMPIYVGLFTALRTAYDVRQQPFVGWVEDLSRPDGLFALGFWPHSFNLLPLVWIALMLVQMLRQPLPTDPQQRQTMMIMRYMPLLFGVMLYNYAAALLVYMVTSMLWTFVESAIVKKILGPIDPNVAGFAPTPM